MALVVDTGPLVAALGRRDRFHETCRTLLEGLHEELVVPSPILVEVDYWLSKGLHTDSVLTFWEDVSLGAYSIANLELPDYVRAYELMRQYADSDIGFVDAAVLAITERLNEPKLATLDHRHFGMMRPRHVDTLRLVPDL